MGTNLRVLHGLSGSSGAFGLQVRPSGSFGRPKHRLAASQRDLVVITYKHRDQSARMHKTAQISFNHTTKPTLTGRS